MPQLNNNPLIARFQEFRQKLYKFFGARRDSIMDLLDETKHKNLVVIARTRSNRVFYQSPSIQQNPKRRGCPKKYGSRFDLALNQTWHEPDETIQTNTTTRRSRSLTVTIQAWHQMLMT